MKKLDNHCQEQLRQPGQRQLYGNRREHIGVSKREGGGRPPVFTLSPGVMARIEAGSESGVADQGYFEAFLFHRDGTGDETPSGKKEFWYLADEANDVYSLPLF